MCKRQLEMGKYSLIKFRHCMMIYSNKFQGSYLFTFDLQYYHKICELTLKNSIFYNQPYYFFVFLVLFTTTFFSKEKL